MKKPIIALVGIVVVTIFASQAEAQTGIRGGRIDRTIDVKDFDDFEIYLPNTSEEIAIYAQWSNGGVVVLEDVTLLCLYGPDGAGGTENEDDDISFGNSRLTSYKVSPGRMWYTSTVSGQRCWVTLDFEHRERYNMSARAKFTIILSETDATEGTWRGASSTDLQRMNLKRAANIARR